jgi:hypothetical protein
MSGATNPGGMHVDSSISWMAWLQNDGALSMAFGELRPASGGASAPGSLLSGSPAARTSRFRTHLNLKLQ